MSMLFFYVFLHPSAIHYAPLPNPSSWSCTSPQLHATLSLCFPSLLTLLQTFCPLHFFRNRTEGIERRWKCRSVERDREEKKLRRSENGTRKSQALEHANDLNKYNIDSSWRILLFGINFWQPSPHSTLHSTLAPPSPHLHPTSPTISPFHLPIPPTPFHLLHPLSASLSFVGGEGERARSCGEAARQGVRNFKRWDRHWHMQKRKEKHILYIAWKTNCLGPPYALQRRHRSWFVPKENYSNNIWK